MFTPPNISVLINDAGFVTQKNELGVLITSAVRKRKEISTDHWKYVDDLTVAEALNLKETLVEDTEKILVKPLTHHDRFELLLPEESSKVQKQLQELESHADKNEMKVNKKKTKAMLFNPSRSKDFTPKLVIANETIELVEEMKLLGVQITSDMKWNSNTNYITKKAYQRLWMVRRLTQMGANDDELLDVYCKQIRSVLEYAAVVWHPGLTAANSSSIERVQKACLAIILGQRYISYTNALQVASLDRLNTRREAQCLTFARKSIKNPKFSSWFVEDVKLINTRRVKKNLKDIQTRTRRFRHSTIPYLTQLLNEKGFTSAAGEEN